MADLDDLKAKLACGTRGAHGQFTVSDWAFVLNESDCPHDIDGVVFNGRTLRDELQRLYGIANAAPALLARLEQAEAKLKELGVTL